MNGLVICSFRPPGAEAKVLRRINPAFRRSKSIIKPDWSGVGQTTGD
jgi:hypothetical protein